MGVEPDESEELSEGQQQFVEILSQISSASLHSAKFFVSKLKDRQSAGTADLLSRMKSSADVPKELGLALEILFKEDPSNSQAVELAFQLVLFARTQESDSRQVLRLLTSGRFFSASGGTTTLKNLLALCRHLIKAEEKRKKTESKLADINLAAKTKGKESPKDAERANKAEDKFKDEGEKVREICADILKELSGIHANIGGGAR